MWALRRAASLARRHDSSFKIAQASYAIKPVAPMTGFEHPDWRSCSNHCVHGLCVQARNIYVGPLSTAKLTSF
ncbi:hypothetical protein HPP92_017724 [Vanilla planifolia]|nr:hypothetical protein HPP92_017724 [Vanilla planifolia]